MLENIDHINIVVRDMEMMKGFYVEVLGLTVSKEATISGEWIDHVVGLTGVEADVVYLDLPQGPRIELIHYRKPQGKAPAGLSVPNTQGIRHFAFRVDDLDGLVSRLRSARVRIFSQAQQVPDQQVRYANNVRKRLVYFLDPENNLLELCEYK